MQITFRDIEKAFEVEEKTIYEWLNTLALPAVKANDQYYFNSAEVLEWALKNKITLTAGALELCEKNRSPKSVLVPALKKGGIYFGIKGERHEDIFDNVLNLLPLPAHVQRPFLREMLLAREQSGTTCIGEGIAIPHVKHPVIFAGLDPVIGLFFLEKRVDFNAFDGEKVHTLFVILSGSFKGHLSLLSRLAFCLQEKTVKSALELKPVREDIIAAFEVAEATALGPGA